MQIGNRTALDTERNALRDRFDALWLASSTIGTLEARAIKCAIALDEPNHRQSGWCWRIYPGGRSTPSGDIVRRRGHAVSVIHA